jgi:hypothetical protein
MTIELLGKLSAALPLLKSTSSACTAFCTINTNTCASLAASAGVGAPDAFPPSFRNLSTDGG